MNKNVNFWYSLKVKPGVSDPHHSPEDGSNTMKGGSREAKGLKSTGGRRTWYGKRETLTPLSPPPNSFLKFRFKENVSILERIM